MRLRRVASCVSERSTVAPECVSNLARTLSASMRALSSETAAFFSAHLHRCLRIQLRRSSAVARAPPGVKRSAPPGASAPPGPRSGRYQLAGVRAVAARPSAVASTRAAS